MRFFLKRIKNSKRGFTIVEVLIACAIISITTFAMISAVSKGIQLSYSSLKNTQANFILEEGAEAVKVIRDNSWTNISSLTLNTDYYLSFNNSTNVWTLGTTQAAAIDGLFVRKVRFSAVNRDANDDIATTGTLDARTKKVDINLSWNTQQGTKTKSLSFYISDIFN